MEAADSPARISLPFANSGTKNTIPTASQVGITPGAASLTTGFPPLTFTPLAAGGVPPSGADFNGILYEITAIQRWQCAGGGFKYNASFSTAVGGYPKGTVLVNTADDGGWLSTVDNNATDPDAGGAGWVPYGEYGQAIIALTNVNVTLSPVQYAKPVILLTGALTGNVQLTFPPLVRNWQIINLTTGAYAVSAREGTGTFVACGQSVVTALRGNGTDALNDGSQLGEGSTVVAPETTDDSAKVVSSGWVRLALSAIATAAGFSFNYDPTNGHIKLPSWLGGFILQWSVGVSDSSGTLTMANDIPFPNAVIGGMANEAYPEGWESTRTTVWAFDDGLSTLTTSVAQSRNIVGTAGPTVDDDIRGRILVWGR